MSKIHTEPLSINLNNHTSQSYLAYPVDQPGPNPGVLVIPEFWGLTEHTKNRANKLAEQGYTAIALDVYGDGWLGKTAEEATQAMNKLYSNIEQTSNQMKGYLKTLKNLKQTNETKTASIGYCLGGALSLHLARMGEDVTGVVSFHGKLIPQVSIQPGTVKAKMLICHGEADTMIPEEDVQAFKKEMDSAHVDYKFISYPEAQHGFTNPQATERGEKFNIPIAYNESADKASWEEMLKFFNRIFV